MGLSKHEHFKTPLPRQQITLSAGTSLGILFGLSLRQKPDKPRKKTFALVQPTDGMAWLQGSVLSRVLKKNCHLPLYTYQKQHSWTAHFFKSYDGLLLRSPTNSKEASTGNMDKKGSLWAFAVDNMGRGTGNLLSILFVGWPVKTERASTSRVL